MSYSQAKLIGCLCGDIPSKIKGRDVRRWLPLRKTEALPAVSVQPEEAYLLHEWPRDQRRPGLCPLPNDESQSLPCLSIGCSHRSRAVASGVSSVAELRPVQRYQHHHPRASAESNYVQVKLQWLRPARRDNLAVTENLHLQTAIWRRGSSEHHNSGPRKLQHEADS